MRDAGCEMKCKKVLIEIMEESGAFSSEALDHIKQCSECVGTVDLIDKLRREGTELRELDMSLQSRRETRRIVASVLSENAETASLFRVPAFTRWRFAGGLAAVAACIAILISLDNRMPDSSDLLVTESISAEVLSERIADLKIRVSGNERNFFDKSTLSNRKSNSFDEKISSIEARVQRRIFQLECELQG